jgi:nucleoside-triphosphatase
MGRTLLLTGRPGVGKTTVIRAVVAQLGARAGGFYTQEARQAGRRVGFRLVLLEGAPAPPPEPRDRSLDSGGRPPHRGDKPAETEGWLARVNEPSRWRVGRYGVSLAFLEQAGVPALRRAMREGWLVVVDEIGKMELFSDAFRSAVQEAVASPAPVLGTVMARPTPWVQELLAQPGVEVWRVSEQNRDEMPAQVLAWALRELRVSVEP